MITDDEMRSARNGLPPAIAAAIDVALGEYAPCGKEMRISPLHPPQFCAKPAGHDFADGVRTYDGCSSPHRRTITEAMQKLLGPKRFTIPPLGARVYVPDERRGYVVRARNDRFAVCTKPHFSTVLYFILDAAEGWRAPEGVVFGLGAESKDDCEEMLERVTLAETELSRRHGVPWDVTHWRTPARQRRA